MIYVVIQFGCIIYLIINSQVSSFNLMPLLLLSLSLIIGSFALINMRLDNLNIIPALKKQHKLTTHGIYRFIRHPMYTSVLLLSSGLMLSNTHPISQLVMLILIIDLILKSNLEERLLNKRFKQYKNYKNNTGRFLPFL